ncbi:MAG: adaptor protein MecA [Clostridiales bacterium]|jgi:adapter protein MecA 1/2|nr:adaptor protein MecA [Clostridiales bacterium]
MKIEKINDNQLKILLSKNDLEERDIKVQELAFGTDKTRDLFKEMMNIATSEYDFNVEGSQLMIEAVPVSFETVMIIVTRIDSKNNIKIKREKEKVDDIAKPKTNNSSTNKKKTDKKNDNFIFEFSSIEDVAYVSRELYNKFNGDSFLVKYKSKFYLLLHSNEHMSTVNQDELELYMSEYGKRLYDTLISFSYFFEHGEILMDTPALDKLSEFY